MFPFFAALAALVLSTQPADPIETELERFNRAMADGDTAAAAPIIDEMIANRIPPDGKPVSDPILNSMIGRVYLLAGLEGPAIEYLQRAPSQSLPQSIRAETSLAYGNALGRRGRSDEALVAFRTASQNAASRSQEFRSAIGSAKQLLTTDPATALRVSAPFLNSGEETERWQPAYISALAQSLLGNRTAAATFADQAWTYAAKAPPRDLAPLHVSVLRAGLATITGDKHAQRAMLAAANAMSVTKGSDLTRQLPVCGDDDLKPSDYVIFGALKGPYHSNSLVPIAASRPSIVAPFYARLAGRAAIKPDKISSAAGTVFTVSCLTRVDSGFIKDGEPSDPIVGWFAREGIYPASIKPESDDPGINKISDRIDDLSRRYGENSPHLIHPQWQLLSLLEVRSMSGDPVPPGRLLELRSRIIESLKHNDAPAEVIELLQLRTEMDRLMRSAASAGRPDISAFKSFWSRLMQQVPFPAARYFIRGLLNSSQEEVSPDQIGLITELGRRAPATLLGRDRQAFLLMVAHAKRSAGLLEEAIRDVAATGLPSDICVRSDSPPSLLEQKYTPDDYPPDLVPAELEGYSLVEFDLTKEGAPKHPRTILSFPSSLFDHVTNKGLDAMRFTPPIANGKAGACRAHTQGVTWRLEGGEEFSPPTLMPDLTGDST